MGTMSKPEHWRVEKHGYNWIVVSEGKPEDENFIADCGEVDDDGEAHANSIVSDHNGCLGIKDSETTVPELVAALEDLRGEQNGPPLLKYEVQWQAACDRADAALAKTGKKPP